MIELAEVIAELRRELQGHGRRRGRAAAVRARPGPGRRPDRRGRAARAAAEEPFGQVFAYLEIINSLTAAPSVKRAGPRDPLRASAHRLLGLVLAGPSWSDALTPLARLDPSALDAVDRALRQVTPA
jgi:hypothetical protein